MPSSTSAPHAPALGLLSLLVSLLTTSCAYWFDGGASAQPVKTTAGAMPKARMAGAARGSEPAPPPGEVLRLRGSATIGSTLAPKLAVAFLTQQGATDAAVALDERERNHTEVHGTVKGVATTVVIDYPGTTAAFEALAAGACDVGMASRPIQEDEADRLSALGDMTSPEAEHVLGMDGVAVIVNKRSRVLRLTTAQIGAIFSGEITNWSGIGGGVGDIHVYARDRASGTFDTFAQLALGSRHLASGTKRFDDNESLVATVAADELGIGFVSLSSIGTKAGEVKAVAVQDGSATPTAPTPFGVATEAYPFSRRLFLYTAERTATTLASQFVEFALSDEGQRVVAATGFAPLTIDVGSTPRASASAPPEYVKATASAQRLSFDFRFRKGAVALDSRSTRDLERLARFVRLTSSKRQVSLLAFTDGDASDPKATELSKQRARSVANLLRSRGVATKAALGFGGAMPVAANDTRDGRRKNNRVEVWLH